MSAREYAPGTVAVATVNGRQNVRVMRVASNLSSAEWASADGAGARLHEASRVTDVRPVVVLDFEAAGLHPSVAVQDIRSLRDTLAWPKIADQIEAQTKPPKPAEPTGLGAVVRDENNELWTRVADNATPWRFMHYKRNWSAINVADVLSEGVTA